MIGDLLASFNVLWYKNTRHFLPVLYLQLPAGKTKSVSITVAQHSEGEVSLLEKFSGFAVAISENRRTIIHVDAY